MAQLHEISTGAVIVNVAPTTGADQTITIHTAAVVVVVVIHLVMRTDIAVCLTIDHRRCESERIHGCTLFLFLVNMYTMCLGQTLKASTLRGHVSRWENISAPNEVIEWIENGVHIPFVNVPESFCLANRHFTPVQTNF